MKYAKGSYQHCSSTGDFSVLFCMVSKLCRVVESGLAGPVLAVPVFQVSHTMIAEVLTINNNIQNYQSLVHCNPIKHQDYLKYRTSIIRRLRIGSCIKLSPYRSYHDPYKAGRS